MNEFGKQYSEIASGQIEVSGIPKEGRALISEFQEDTLGDLLQSQAFKNELANKIPPAVYVPSYLQILINKINSRPEINQADRAQMIMSAFADNQLIYSNDQILENIVISLPERSRLSFLFGLGSGNCRTLAMQLQVALSHVGVSAYIEGGPFCPKGEKVYIVPGHAQVVCLIGDRKLILDPTRIVDKECQFNFKNLIHDKETLEKYRALDGEAAYKLGQKIRSEVLEKKDKKSKVTIERQVLIKNSDSENQVQDRNRMTSKISHSQPRGHSLKDDYDSSYSLKTQELIGADFQKLLALEIVTGFRKAKSANSVFPIYTDVVENQKLRIYLKNLNNQDLTTIKSDLVYQTLLSEFRELANGKKFSKGLDYCELYGMDYINAPRQLNRNTVFTDFCLAMFHHDTCVTKTEHKDQIRYEQKYRMPIELEKLSKEFFADLLAPNTLNLFPECLLHAGLHYKKDYDLGRRYLKIISSQPQILSDNHFYLLTMLLKVHSDFAGNGFLPDKNELFEIISNLQKYTNFNLGYLFLQKLHGAKDFLLSICDVSLGLLRDYSLFTGQDYSSVLQNQAFNFAMNKVLEQDSFQDLYEDDLARILDSLGRDIHEVENRELISSVKIYVMELLSRLTHKLSSDYRHFYDRIFMEVTWDSESYEYQGKNYKLYSHLIPLLENQILSEDDLIPYLKEDSSSESERESRHVQKAKAIFAYLMENFNILDLDPEDSDLSVQICKSLLLYACRRHERINGESPNLALYRATLLEEQLESKYIEYVNKFMPLANMYMPRLDIEMLFEKHLSRFGEFESMLLFIAEPYFRKLEKKYMDINFIELCQVESYLSCQDFTKVSLEQTVSKIYDSLPKITGPNFLSLLIKNRIKSYLENLAKTATAKEKELMQLPETSFSERLEKRRQQVKSMIFRKAYLQIGSIPTAAVPDLQQNESSSQGDSSSNFDPTLRFRNRIRKATAERDNFDSLKTYSPGDDLRLIDWKATARSDNIRVKEYQKNQNNLKTDLEIIIDSSSLLYEAFQPSNKFVHKSIGLITNLIQMKKRPNIRLYFHGSLIESLEYQKLIKRAHHTMNNTNCSFAYAIEKKSDPMDI